MNSIDSMESVELVRMYIIALRKMYIEIRNYLQKWMKIQMVYIISYDFSNITNNYHFRID